MVVHYHLQWYVWCMQELLMLWLHPAIFESYGNYWVLLDNLLFCQWNTCPEMIRPLSCGVVFRRVCVHFMFFRHYYTVLLSCVLIILHALCSGIFQLFSVGHFFTCLQQGACSFDSLVLWVFSVPSWQTFVWVVTLYSGLVIRLYVKVEKERNSISFSWRSWNVLYRD